ncbi:proton channel OTOP3-like [Bombina bombina]|uniref:proton channel OTOP3-like n=1 Tax=Bombina bombina TaxID=8345 RepID=UPI00235AE1BB|nr:proton channel OTOP3-like [Bombina bombina]
MDTTEPSQFVHYERSWLHRHCPSPIIQHQLAQGSGQLFSGLLAMNIVFLGAAVVSSVILAEGSVSSKVSDIFMCILMLLSTGWAFYHLLCTRRKPHALPIQDRHAGALWVKASLILFGICSLLLIAFKISYRVMLLQCDNLTTDILFASVELLFICVQTCLLWFTCKDCIQVQHNLTRFGLMLTLSTNLLLWILDVIIDSVNRKDDIQENITLRLKRLDMTSCTCGNDSPCWTFKHGYVTLYPFKLEYCLICASMLFVMWKNVGRREHGHSSHQEPRFHLKGVVYGPFLGGAVLLVGLCIFIQYQVQASAGMAPLTSFLFYYAYCVTLLPIMIISCIIGTLSLSLGEKDRHIGQHREKKDDMAIDEKHRLEMELEQIGEDIQHNKENNESIHCNGERGEHWNSKEEDIQVTEENKENWKNKKGENRTENGEQCEVLGEDNQYMQDDDDDDQRKLEQRMENRHDAMVDQTAGKRTKYKDGQGKKEQRDILDGGHKHTNVMGDAKNYTRSLDIVLLLAAALGHFSISYFSLVAIVATNNWNLLNSLNLAYSVLMILQHMSQNIFIIEGLRGDHGRPISPHPNTEEAEEQEDLHRRMSLMDLRRASLAYLQDMGRLSISRRSVKEISLFLVLCNIMFWIMSAFGAHPQYENGLEQEFYGNSTWLSILNFGLPLSVFYRMHSVGGLLEVYISA